MPHVIVKLWLGKSENQKRRLAEAITKDVMNVLNYGEESVSVAMEEVKSGNWTETVYKPDIKDKWDQLYKKQEAGVRPVVTESVGVHANGVHLLRKGPQPLTGLRAQNSTFEC